MQNISIRFTVSTDSGDMPATLATVSQFLGRGADDLRSHGLKIESLNVDSYGPPIVAQDGTSIVEQCREAVRDELKKHTAEHANSSS